MNRVITKFQETPLSTYGYGMMASSTAILFLMINGFFNRVGVELFAAWFIVAMACASGALSVLMITKTFPHLSKPSALFFVTLLTILLMGGYMTSFFGYSKVYVIYNALQNPQATIPENIPFDGLTMTRFLSLLEQLWAAVGLSAVVCTISYLLIHLFTPDFQSLVQKDKTSNTPEGLAE